MAHNAAITQADGSTRARIVQGTQQTVGSLHIGVMGAHGPDAHDPVGHARLELRVHNDLAPGGSGTPEVVRLRVGEPFGVRGVGTLLLAGVVPASATERAVVFLELNPV